MQNNELELRKDDVFNTKTLVKKLENYMDKVTEKECTAETVQAAVSCAGTIIDILKLHLDLERVRIRRN